MRWVLVLAVLVGCGTAVDRATDEDAGASTLRKDAGGNDSSAPEEDAGTDADQICGPVEADCEVLALTCPAQDAEPGYDGMHLRCKAGAQPPFVDPSNVNGCISFGSGDWCCPRHCLAMRVTDCTTCSGGERDVFCPATGSGTPAGCSGVVDAGMGAAMCCP